MSRKQALQSFSQDLHISNNQLFTYLNCSLKYRYHYVEARPPERISISLPFGSAIHSAIEMYYRSLKNHGRIEPLEALCDRFETCLDLDFEHAEVPVIFKKNLPDHKSAVVMGNAILKVFHETIAQIVQNVQEIVAVELPLTAKLYTEDSQPTEFKLSGILDLVLRDENGEILVVDNKTAAQSISQTSADENNQMTSYAYLLAANKYVFPTSPVKCRFDVLRKLKTPKLETVQTIRTAQDRKRFAKIANAVLDGIDAGIYMPQPNWLCSDCSYTNACKAW